MTRTDPIDRLLRPFERFLKTQATGGILLLVAAVVAMVWANSPWRDAYHALWPHSLAICTEDRELVRAVHHWINEGLMAMLSFVVGLELKCELAFESMEPRQQAKSGILIASLAAGSTGFAILRAAPSPQS